MIENENNYVVYKATNIETNESYIGSTTGSLEKRKNDHIQKAKKGCGYKFQEAIGTYGSEAFSWEQIDTASSINELAEKEKHYITEYNSLYKGYNADSGGGFKKNVYQYNTTDGTLIAVYEDLQSAANAVDAKRKSISNSCLEYNKSCKGYYWSYELQPLYKPIDKRLKEVLQFSLAGEFIAKYKSVAEASKKTGLSKTCIARVCRGEREYSGGFKWKYSS